MPLALIGRDGNRRVLVAVDQAAQAAGLRVAMPVTKAQVLVPNLVLQDAQPQADAEGLESLALWMLQRIAPIVAVDAPAGIVIDSTGADHLHGGEQEMLDGILGRLTLSGVNARGAIADTLGAAHALARWSARPTFIAPEEHGAFPLVSLPLEALRLPSGMGAQLRLLGFERIGELLDKPRAPLTLRFGPELGRRLDQLIGKERELIEPVRPAELIEARRAFAEPISAAETIARYIEKLVGVLCAELEKQNLGARTLDLVCHRVDNNRQAVRIGTATPVRDAKRLTRLLCDKIETIDPGFGIEIMSLTASLAEPFARKQFASSLIQEPVADVSDLIDTLINRVGERAIYRAVPVSSDVPERSVTHVAALSPDTGMNWPDHWPRPSRLLAHAEQIETVALLPDHPPVSFTWRGIRRRVKRADGPERVFGEWWKRDAELVAVRDYFRVEDEAGERYWIYRAGDGEHQSTGSHKWYLHGMFG